MSSIFLKRLAEQLDALDDRQKEIFFNGYNTSDISLFSDIECNDVIHFEPVLSQDMTYDVDEIRQKSVYRFTSIQNEEVMVMFHGTYQSYSGEHYHGWKFVHPVDKTIIVYEDGIA